MCTLLTLHYQIIAKRLQVHQTLVCVLLTRLTLLCMTLQSIGIKIMSKLLIANVHILLLLMIPSLMYCNDWTDWSKWSQCSNTCGNGISSKERECLSQNCTGPSHLYKSCQTKACSSHQIYSFRDQLCATMNTMYMQNSQYLSWTALRDTGDDSTSCSLMCQSGIYVMPLRNDISMNGARCTRSNGENGVCLGKYCAPTGCNRVLGASTELSKCFHCPSYLEYTSTLQCKRHFITLVTAPQGDRLVSVIPRDSTWITIAFHRIPNVALATSKTLFPIQLGNTTVPFNLGGTTFNIISNDTISALGPLNEDITIMVEPTEGESGPTVEYYRLVNESVRLPIVDDKNETTYSWHYGDYSDCSVTCGAGIEVAHVHCRDNEFPDNIIPDSFCSKTPDKKPFPIVRKCSLNPCPPRWKVYDWGQCSAICNGGTQSRTVTCVQSDGNDNDRSTETETECKEIKPKTTRSCNTHECGKWKTSKWSECSLKCGHGGNQTRSVTCTDSQGKEMNSINCHHPRPPSKKPCNNGECHYLWKTGPWSQCSTSCGNGTQHRAVVCTTHTNNIVNNSLCQSLAAKPVELRTCFNVTTCNKLWAKSPWSQCEGHCGESHQIRNVTCQALISTYLYIVSDSVCNVSTKPETRKKCNKTGCAYWRTEPWGKCTQSCGSGTQIRTVQCITLNTGQPSTECDQATKPSNSTICNTSKCPTNCSDSPRLNCLTMITPQNNLCKYSYFRDDVCCKTCASLT